MNTATHIKRGTTQRPITITRYNDGTGVIKVVDYYYETNLYLFWDGDVHYSEHLDQDEAYTLDGITCLNLTGTQDLSRPCSFIHRLQKYIIKLRNNLTTF